MDRHEAIDKTLKQYADGKLTPQELTEQLAGIMLRTECSCLQCL